MPLWLELIISWVNKLRRHMISTACFNYLQAYCNWMNVRLLEVVANASGNSKLVNLFIKIKSIPKHYEKFGIVFHIIRSEPSITVKYKQHLMAKILIMLLQIDLEQLIRYCEPYLIKDIAKHMLIRTIEEGSLKITWFIPTDKVHESYLSALMLPQESRLDSYLQIGDWVVYNPLLVLQMLQRECCKLIMCTIFTHMSQLGSE